MRLLASICRGKLSSLRGSQMPDEPKLNEPEITETKSHWNTANQVEFGPGAMAGRFYTNHIQANVTMFEVRVTFNFVTGVNEKSGRLLGQESLMVSMAPELASALHALLGRSIENYRNQ